MKALLVLAVILASIIAIKVTTSAIKKYGAKKQVSTYRIEYLSKTISIGLMVFCTILAINISGYAYSQISIFLSSVFAVIGVALFAQWSILSNITASLIIFFGFPYRVGDHIRIIDEKEDIAGTIKEITLFHVLIKRDQELITYPNSLILQKGVIKNPQKRVEVKVEDSD